MVFLDGGQLPKSGGEEVSPIVRRLTVIPHNELSLVAHSRSFHNVRETFEAANIGAALEQTKAPVWSELSVEE